MVLHASVNLMCFDREFKVCPNWGLAERKDRGKALTCAGSWQSHGGQQCKWGFLGCKDSICKVQPCRLAKSVLTFWDISELTFIPHPKISYKENSDFSFWVYSDGFLCFMYVVERFSSNGNVFGSLNLVPTTCPISHGVMQTVVQEHHLPLPCGDLASQPKPPLPPYSKSQAVPILHHAILAVWYF